MSAERCLRASRTARFLTAGWIFFGTTPSSLTLKEAARIPYRFNLPPGPAGFTTYEAGNVGRPEGDEGMPQLLGIERFIQPDHALVLHRSRPPVRQRRPRSELIDAPKAAVEGPIAERRASWTGVAVDVATVSERKHPMCGNRGGANQ